MDLHRLVHRANFMFARGAPPEVLLDVAGVADGGDGGTDLLDATASSWRTCPKVNAQERAQHRGWLELRIAIVTWIERTYHRRRRQHSLCRLTPIEFETIMTARTTQAA